MPDMLEKEKKTSEETYYEYPQLKSKTKEEISRGGRDGAAVISGCQELPPLFSAGVAGPRLCPA